MNIKEIKNKRENLHYVESYIERLTRSKRVLIDAQSKVLFAYTAYCMQEEKLKIELDLSSELTKEIEKYFNDFKLELEEINKEFTKDDLLAYIIFGQKYLGRDAINSTPESISKLALEILKIENNDKVIDICSGKGDFLLKAYEENQNASYSGIEIDNKNINNTVIREKLLGQNWNLIHSDVLKIIPEDKYDKVFLNYVFGEKNEISKELKEMICKNRNIEKKLLSRSRNDWKYHFAALEYMKDSGKAVAIVSPSGMNNDTNLDSIKYFIENGYIESVIALPSSLLEFSNIAQFLLVFSKGNKFVNMVDATNYGKKECFNTILEDKDVKEIFNLIGSDSENSKRIPLVEIKNKSYNLNPLVYTKKLPDLNNGKELGEIANIKRGTQIKSVELKQLETEEKTPYRYIVLSDIEDGVLLDKKHYLESIPKEQEKYCVTKEALVISKTGFPYLKAAKVKAENGEKILVTGNMYIVEIKEDKDIDPDYILAFLSSDLGIETLKSISAGASTLSIFTIGNLKEVIVPFLDKKNQDEIASRYKETVKEMKLLKKMYNEKKKYLEKIFD